VLLNPGPVMVHERVRAAMSYPDVCHREPEVAELMTAVRAKVAQVCQLADPDLDGYSSVLLSGSGTAALEATLSSVVPRDGKILVLDNGNYGERMHRIAAVHGIAHEWLRFGWTNPVDIAAVDQALTRDPAITHVALAHHETSTGMLNPLRAIGDVVHKHGRSLVVDAISSLGCEEIDVRADHVDWCVGTANKCIEGLPGISFVCASRAAFDALANVPPRTLYLDVHGHYRSQEDLRAPLFTPAVQVLYAFDRALDLTLAETVAGRHARYATQAERLRAGLAELGLRFLLPEEHRACSVTHLHLPDGIAYPQLHDALKREGFIVYACQEQLGAVFRVANMGQLTEEDVDRFLAAMRRTLAQQPRPATVG
jgi:2-aminoethylphosphonate-pyruvate transaminase